MRKMDILSITTEMVSIVREHVSHYQTDLVYDIATMSDSDAPYTCWLWLVREHGTHLILCDETNREYVSSIYDVFDEQIKSFLIDKRFDTRASKYYYKIYELSDREEALMYV